MAASRARCGERVAAALSRFGAALAAATLAGAAWASAALISDLEQRLAQGGVESVNRYLNAHPTSAMAALNQKTAACELPAVSLAVRLSRSTNARAVQAHGESLRAAAGGCAAFVLALVTPQEIPRVCASVAAWRPAQTARELRRRIGAIDADEHLRSNRLGRACRAAYLYELQNTRVVVRGAAPPTRGAGQ